MNCSFLRDLLRAILALGLFVLLVLAPPDAQAYTALAASPDELRKTLVVVKGLATQADADREAIDHCKTVANSLDVGYAAANCRVVFRQIVAGHGAVACDDRLCTIGSGAVEQSARDDAVARCKKNSKAAARCALVPSMGWRDDKVSTQAELDAAEAAKSSTANVSTDRSSLYGLMVGKSLLAQIPACAGQSLAKGQPYCYNLSEPVFNDPNTEMVRVLQLRRYDIVINQQMFDVTSLYSHPFLGRFAWAQAWVSKDGVIRRLRFQTSLVEAGSIRANLTQKFGNPTNEDLLDWIDNRTGAIVQQSPRITWDTRDYRVFFDTRAATTSDNPNGDRGAIETYDMSLLEKYWDYQKNKKPQQRGM